MKLTLFHDGNCPLCGAEIAQLRKSDRHGLLCFEDIHAPDFRDRFPHLDPSAADRVLHGQLEDGTMLYGLDVTVRAWTSVGRHRWLRVLRWPLVGRVADLGYRFFARHRHLISLLLTGRRRLGPSGPDADVGRPACQPGKNARS